MKKPAVSMLGFLIFFVLQIYANNCVERTQVENLSCKEKYVKTNFSSESYWQDQRIKFTSEYELPEDETVYLDEDWITEMVSFQLRDYKKHKRAGQNQQIEVNVGFYVQGRHCIPFSDLILIYATISVALMCLKIFDEKKIII